ncbi:hypothetical protein MHK_007631 [Candidatus Magnetomorum sp. HK-1]|nr:hypothetical protein MHK_007631 [Candidatus Magnetomorum sp. HK-1]
MTEYNQKPTIFISYSHEDKSEKDQILKHLELTAKNNGFNV